MQTPTRGMPRWLLLGILLLALTACATTETRAPLADSSDRSGGWNDTDARLTATAMIKDALDRPWVRRFTQMTGREPVVMVGAVRNRTHEQLNMQTFSTELRQALRRSGLVQLADTAQPPAGRADFILQGTIHTLVDERNGSQAVVYQVDLELVDAASEVKVWVGQKNVNKQVQRSKTTL
jgi:PBP1b-binding outer membrane lipoprotein LpoB